MEKNNISFFEEIYYWNCYYFIKLKMKIDFTGTEPTYDACIYISFLKTFNILSIVSSFDFICNMIKNVNDIFFISVNLFCFLLIIVYWLIDCKLYFSKRDSIINKCNLFTIENRKKSKRKYWLYIIISLIAFCVSFYLLITGPLN